MSSDLFKNVILKMGFEIIYLMKKKLYTRTDAKEAVLLPVKSSSDDDPGFRHGFGAEAS